MPIEPEIFAVDAEHCIAGWDAFFIEAWKVTRAPAVDAAAVFVKTFSAGKPKVSALVVVSPDAPMPDAAARASLERFMKEIPADTRCVAYVYEGTGLRAAGIRSLMAFLSMLTVSSTPSKVVSTVGEGLAWIAKLDPEPARVAGRAEAVAIVKQRLEAAGKKQGGASAA